MDDIKVIEDDLENVEKKCEKVDCKAIYDVIIAHYLLLQEEKLKKYYDIINSFNCWYIN